MKTAKEFLDLCGDQGCEILDADLKDELELSGPLLGERAIFHSFNTLSDRLFRSPTESRKIPLVSQPIELPTEFVSDTPSRLLAGIINSALEPTRETDFDVLDARDDRCSAAEIAFLGTTELLRARVDDGYIEENDGTKIITKNGAPLLLKKIFEVPTSLALEPLNVRGIQYPAGSIFSVVVPPRVLVGELTRADISNVTQIGFLRLSQFALTPAERIELNPPMLKKSELEKYLSITIPEIGRLATRALEFADPAMPWPLNRLRNSFTGQRKTTRAVATVHIAPNHL